MEYIGKDKKSEIVIFNAWKEKKNVTEDER